MDWLTAVLSNPLTDKAFAVVLVFVLLKFMHDDIGALVRSMSELKEEIANDRTHSASRMTEVREFMREMIQMWVRTEERTRK